MTTFDLLQDSINLYIIYKEAKGTEKLDAEKKLRKSLSILREDLDNVTLTEKDVKPVTSTKGKKAKEVNIEVFTED